MKIFLSWSGPQSKAVAQALNDWLPRVIQAVRVFFSPDIEKGARWSTEIDGALEGTSFGIVCLTPDNLKSEWIHYEAGALSKTPDARVWTFLLGLKPSEVPPPLGRFQHTVAEREDLRKLVGTINGHLTEPLAPGLLDEVFEDAWPRLEKRLREAQAQTAPQADLKPRPAGRDQESMFAEILELLRGQDRRLTNLEVRDPAIAGSSQVPAPTMEAYWDQGERHARFAAANRFSHAVRRMLESMQRVEPPSDGISRIRACVVQLRSLNIRIGAELKSVIAKAFPQASIDMEWSDHRRMVATIEWSRPVSTRTVNDRLSRFEHLGSMCTEKIVWLVDPGATYGANSSEDEGDV